ncbi:MAG: hypothetical protein NTW21_16065 [Verrucomicrobia bacterium]|nr:hypothetical protein [Verrucomicrobiota bacterium]
MIIDQDSLRAQQAAGEALAVAERINDACSPQMADAQVQSFCRKAHGQAHQGATSDRGMWQEKRIDDCSSKGSALNSGGPVPLPSGNRRDIGSQRTGDTAAGIRESDPPMVVGDGNTCDGQPGLKGYPP